MRVLVVGGGAREHALCWKIRASPRLTELYCAPGNPGIGACATLVPIAATASDELVSWAREHEVAIVVVGPEAALAAGLSDAMISAGISVVGPTRAAAMIESSKSFAKEVMDAAKVPTAAYRVFTDAESLRAHCKEVGAPLVLKSDGLASGKGVFVITDNAQFSSAISSLFGALGATKVVAEEFLAGEEVSCIFASNGSEVVALAPAHDYKRLGDRDQGPNTGGMGSVCPSPRVSSDDVAWIGETIAQPVIDVMRARGTTFSGFLYAGLMVPLRSSGPASERRAGIRVLEFNARLGDPECQSILTQLEGDPLPLMEWIAGKVPTKPLLSWSADVSTGVVIASDGYPEAPATGDPISGVDLVALVPGCTVFHAATALDSRGTLISTGGRTLTIVGRGHDSREARRVAYKGVDLVQLRGRRVRRDIGE